MKEKKKTLLIIIVLLIGVLFLINGITLAKYVSNKVWNYYLKTKEFYFSSSILKDTNQENINNFWDGNSIQLDLKNNLNDSLITGYDIDYEVSCEVMGNEKTLSTCKLNNTTNSITGVLSSGTICNNNTEDGIDTSLYDEATCNRSGYDWQNELNTANITLTVYRNDNSVLDDVTVHIIARSTNPYSKALEGTFVLHRKNNYDESIKSEIVNNDNYSDLIITNRFSQNKCLSVAWDSTKIGIIDEVQIYELDSNNNINQFKSLVEKETSKHYSFYSKNNQQIRIEDFEIIESLGC